MNVMFVFFQTFNRYAENRKWDIGGGVIFMMILEMTTTIQSNCIPS